MISKKIIDMTFQTGITEDGHSNFTHELYQMVEALAGAIKTGDKDYQHYILGRWEGDSDEG